MSAEQLINAFPGLVDLASERLGGRVLFASDEFFASAENLLKPEPPVFIPGKYTDRGKWMDGWETRRKRTPGYDWCIIKLGCAGIVRGVDVDTSFFLGNNPAFASLDGCTADRISISSSAELRWIEIVPRLPLAPGSHNFFSVARPERFTHVRLNIFPDGGVARLRIYGTVMPDWKRLRRRALVDLAAVGNGGLAIAASDMFFSPMNNLIMPGRAKTMADGWETRRRRGPGHDWVIIKLGHAGTIKRIEVDTNHFKGNYPDRCSLDVCYAPSSTATSASAEVDALTRADISWTEILPPTQLHPHRRHFFEKELKDADAATHVRLNIYPDGGVSRLRVWGRVSIG